MGYKEYQGVLQLKQQKIVSRKPFKSYNRSLKGCINCKRRKIKCDETKEQCMNCVRRKLDCKWPEPVEKPIKVENDVLETPVEPSAVLESPQQLVRYGSPETSLPIQIDSIFLVQFAQRFLPTLAQPHFNHRVPTQSLVHAVSEKSDLVRQMSIACGASLVAFDDQAFRPVARSRYVTALSSFIKAMRNGFLGSEEWLFLAVQVLQTLSLRDPMAGCNATRCAVHLNAAYELFISRILRSDALATSLERVMIENFLFNYSLTIMFCDHTKIEELIPSPFVLFFDFHTRFLTLCEEDEYPQFSRLSIIAFQIAAKATWSCRLSLPLLEYEKHLHIELLQLAETCLFMSETLEAPASVQIFDTLTVTKVVLHTSIILLKKMIEPCIRASVLQPSIDALVRLVKGSNDYVVIPIWSSFIAASASTKNEDRQRFIQTLEKLMARSGSHLINRVYNYLEALWEIYTGDEPFDLLLDTTALSKICD
ncbi:hypothetical protein FT663_04118 [Candidozyma haemuli var. vulneris]|uniref:Zn(2)-C6 fungal-type domain-containing protein n=1 Tax=Candidozyma haemuli TaxID=45357 RepID=A0A2V1AXX4_9ASCO|nr:hypothetical protein CXQ85_004934 [[Candida] haemuloni]KAF3986955.1 hypothetical protein FT662_04275 [[Candida] haemuloni var. vulneris]KAF3988233.1 hypothetical protein FT663_04118 [[Candida] haemuloni var. vulneris]PVH22366.1 hypothetical protein CXQ85_004934 [[Candida] haemuloni]